MPYMVTLAINIPIKSHQYMIKITRPIVKSFDRHRRQSIDQSLTFVQLMVSSKRTAAMLFHHAVLLLCVCQGSLMFRRFTSRSNKVGCSTQMHFFYVHLSSWFQTFKIDFMPKDSSRFSWNSSHCPCPTFQYATAWDGPKPLYSKKQHTPCWWWMVAIFYIFPEILGCCHHPNWLS